MNWPLDILTSVTQHLVSHLGIFKTMVSPNSTSITKSGVMKQLPTTVKTQLLIERRMFHRHYSCLKLVKVRLAYCIRGATSPDLRPTGKMQQPLKHYNLCTSFNSRPARTRFGSGSTLSRSRILHFGCAGLVANKTTVSFWRSKRLTVYFLSKAQRQIMSSPSR